MLLLLIRPDQKEQRWSTLLCGGAQADDGGVRLFGNVDRRDAGGSCRVRRPVLGERIGLTRPRNDPRADLRRALNSPTSTVLADMDNGVIAATVMVGHDGYRRWVYYLAARPEFQRQGRGRTMMRAAEGWLRRRGPSEAQSVAPRRHQCVKDFYTRIRYRRDHAVVLSRRLGWLRRKQPPRARKPRSQLSGDTSTPARIFDMPPDPPYPDSNPGDLIPTVTVRGDAIIRAEPDEALLWVTLSALEDPPGPALSDVSARSNALVSMLDALGMARADRSTTAITV